MRKRKSWKGLIAVVSVLAMAVFIFSCTDEETKNYDSEVPDPVSLTGSIQGVVVDINNNPVVGATVTLAYGGGTVSKTTDDAGQYLFTGVPVSGALDCHDDCDENPYLISVSAEGYALTYTAALLSFTTLQAIHNITSPHGFQAVENLMVSAIPAVMRRPNAIVQGYVSEQMSGGPISGALVTMNLDDGAPPSPWDIWNDEESTCAVPDGTVTTDDTGLFVITGVPEGTDADKLRYIVTVSAAGFAPCEATVQVGTGGHTYWVNNGTAITLAPAIPQGDTIAPWVKATNLPPNKIGHDSLSGPFTLSFNEPVEKGLLDFVIRVSGGAPIPVEMTWDETDPNSPTLVVTPSTALPEGRTIYFELIDVEDLAGNAYTGKDPLGNDDAFMSLGTAVPGQFAVVLKTSGDPTLMQASNLAQATPTVSEIQPVGGKSGNVPQANNINFFDWRNAAGVNVVGNADGEANQIVLNWDPAQPAEAGETGQVRSYSIYAEFGTGGFSSGIPVLVEDDVGTDLVDPETTWEGTLTDINTAIANYNASNPPGDPDLPLVADKNGTATTWFFDDGFTVNMAVTAINSDDREGPYSNVISVGDVVPPTVADQGEGFDTASADPTNWAFKTVTVDVTAVDADGDGQYNAADYQTFAAQSGDVDVLMSEDLDPATASGTLTAAGGGGETLASVSVTNAEYAPGALPKVTMVLNGISQVQEGDYVQLNVADEAGNASESDATVLLKDGVPPIVAEAVVQDDADNPDQVVVTFSEPVDQATAETAANYNLPAAAGAIASAALDTGGTIVTLTATADLALRNIHEGFDTDTGLAIAATNLLVVSNVQDAQGNATPGTLAFQLVDEIQPRILAAFTRQGGTPYGINNNAPNLTTADGRWDVGDTGTWPETYTLFVVTSEPVVWDQNEDNVLDATDAEACGISAVASPSATYSDVTVLDPLASTVLVFSFELLDGQTVVEGDSLTLVAHDLSGNEMNPGADTIVLKDDNHDGVGDGINIE